MPQVDPRSGTSIALPMMVAFSFVLLAMGPKTFAASVETRVALAGLVRAAVVQLDPFLIGETPIYVRLQQSRWQTRAVSPWREEAPVPFPPASLFYAPAPPAPVDPPSPQLDTNFGEFVIEFGWKPVILVGSFGSALLLMLIGWWRIARAVRIENRRRPPEWDRY